MRQAIKSGARHWYSGKAFVLGAAAGLLLVFLLLLSLPTILLWEQKFESKPSVQPFPVSVNADAQTITEDPAIENMLSSAPQLTGAAANAAGILSTLAAIIVSSPWYEMLGAADVRAVVIDPGFRKEQVATAFGKALGWNTEAQKTFLSESTSPSLNEGEYSPGTYVLAAGMSNTEAKTAISDRFEAQILSRYSTSTEDAVPLDEALTIASMIERETSDWDEMRQISGIIWNRIFTGMNLQIDATVQYAKANKPTTKSWWPALTSSDKYIKSPYNTYLNGGLPPGPIANPSVAAVIAALNPIKTSCLFYFHDKTGGFHCSETYTEHVALLKKYYGQGK